MGMENGGENEKWRKERRDPRSKRVQLSTLALSSRLHCSNLHPTKGVFHTVITVIYFKSS